jgi:hypothetical protein
MCSMLLAVQMSLLRVRNCGGANRNVCLCDGRVWCWWPTKYVVLAVGGRANDFVINVINDLICIR